MSDADLRLSLYSGQWDLAIDALQRLADSDDPQSQAASDLAVLLRSEIDRIVPGTYGGCEEVTAARTCPECGEPQEWCEETACLLYDLMGGFHWSHADGYDGPCRNLGDVNTDLSLPPDNARTRGLI